MRSRAWRGGVAGTAQCGFCRCSPFLSRFKHADLSHAFISAQIVKRTATDPEPNCDKARRNAARLSLANWLDCPPGFSFYPPRHGFSKYLHGISPALQDIAKFSLRLFFPLALALSVVYNLQRHDPAWR
jgi:hypothetical protein